MRENTKAHVLEERMRILAWVKDRICDYKGLPDYGATDADMYQQHKGRVLQLQELEVYLSQSHGIAEEGSRRKVTV